MENDQLYPVSSELVIYLGLTNPEEIRQVLADICHRFGYRIKLIPSGFDPLHNPGIVVDIDKIGVNKSLKVMTYAGMILDPLNTSLERTLDQRQITREFYFKHVEDHINLRNMVAFISNHPIDPNQTIYLVLMDQQNVFVEITFQVCSGFDDSPGLSLQASESTSISEYPILGNVFLMNPQKYKYLTFDGGSISDFEEWLELKLANINFNTDTWAKQKNYEEAYIRNFSFEGNEQ